MHCYLCIYAYMDECVCVRIRDRNHKESPVHAGILVRSLTSLLKGFRCGSPPGIDFFIIFTFKFLNLCL